MAGNPILSAFGSSPPPSPEPATQSADNPIISAYATQNPIVAAYRRLPKAVDKTLGTPLVEAHKDPIRAFSNLMEAPQRGAEALVLGKNPWEAITHPQEREELQQGIREKIGLQQQEEPGGFLSGDDLPHKVLSGVANFGVDMGTDPVTYLPVGKIAEGAARAFPAVAKGAEDLAKYVRESPLGQMFDPEAELKGLTPRGRAVVTTELHRAHNASRVDTEAVGKILARNQQAIRQTGELPPEVAARFKAIRDTGAVKKTALEEADAHNPRALWDAYKTERAQLTRAEYQNGLRANGMLEDHSHYLASERGRENFEPSHYAAGAEDTLKDTQERAMKYGEHPAEVHEWLRATKALVHYANKMFLAISIPHMFNLGDLSYMRYGIMTTLAGMGHALAIAAGKQSPRLDALTDILDRFGGIAQYSPVFDEMGIKRIAGIPGTEGAAQVYNKAMLPFQRASNYLQEKTLNPLETGLRAASYEKEALKGGTDEEITSRIHRTFGSNEPNKFSRLATQMGAPFAKFHVQTAVGSGLRTLATNPGRVTAINKALLDFNDAVNPSGPQYRMSIPGASTARALVDPQHYFPQMLGPLAQLAGNYSALTQFQKGKVAEALSTALQTFVPVEQVVETINELISGEKGRSGESGVQDIAPSLVGGYYQRPSKQP